MKLDEFAFVNQQLASMLKDGIPLEGALRQLCATMQRGELRSELQQLEADLASGVHFGEALEKRKLPSLYVRVVRVGLQSNDLPGALLMLADYYQRMHSVWTRLKGLMVYPVIVLVMALGLSVMLAWVLRGPFQDFASDPSGKPMFETATPAVWVLPVILALLAVALITALASPTMRAWLRWNVPAFKEASLSQLASAMALMLKGGCRLDEALGLLRDMEDGTAAGAELARWQARVASGHGRLAEITEESRVFPTLFLWVVAAAGEDPASGFRHAAELYHDRSVRRIEMLLYAVMPVSIVVLGFAILGQFASLFRGLLIAALSGMGPD